MRIAAEYLPALNYSGQHIVLMHGWASSREVWRPLVAHLRSWADLTLIDIPGCTVHPGDAFNGDFDSLLGALLEKTPTRAVYMGWSLGGQIATALAARSPERVSAVVTLCSNPRFREDQDWPGMSAADFEEFVDGYRLHQGRGLRRFNSLQSSSVESGENRALMREFQALSPAKQPADGLNSGLEWLAQLDLRSVLVALNAPQLHMLGTEDALVPVGVAGRLQTLLARISSASVEPLATAGHGAVLSHPALIAIKLKEFLAKNGLIRAADFRPPQYTKLEVAASFSLAAAAYDSVAALQRDVGDSLLEKTPGQDCEVQAVLDLGCGTGHFHPALRSRFPAASYIGLDLASGMVAFCKEAYPGETKWLVGDAEKLPLAAASMDLIFSSLALQWCDRPDLIFAELARVLKPGGTCVFTSLGPGTLHELRAAWGAVDQYQHVNNFLPVEHLLAAAGSLQDVSLTVETRPFVMHYDKVGDLLTELKTLGAHNMNSGRPAGLTSRGKLRTMIEAYEVFRQDGQLPASYEVLLGELRKL